LSTGVRIGLAAVLLLGAGLFVFALTMPDPEEPAPPADTGAKAPEVVEGPPAKPGLLDSPENCQECHAEIYAEWTSDRHGQAWVGQLYTELSKNHQDASCWSCHAPRPILETGLESPAEARQNFRETGINCLSCHKRGNHVVTAAAPDGAPAPEAACGPVRDPHFPTDRPDLQEATIAFCGVCHNLHGTHEEFRGSRYYREGETCLTCHMAEQVMGPVAKGGAPRLRRVHRFPGAHSEAMLKRAMQVEAQERDGRIVARVVNVGAGHRVPTDARHRAIRLRVAFFDPYGGPVPVADPESGRQEREVTIDLIRLFYRQEQKEPTQIDPDGTAGKDNWRESSIAVPEGAKGGSARLRLYYNLSPYAPVEKGTLVQEVTVKLG